MKPVKSSFFESKSRKPFVRFLRGWFLGKSYSDIEVAKNLSSMLTHSIIELEHKGPPYFSALEIQLQSSSLNKFLSGGIDQNALREIYIRRFGTYL